MSIENAKAFLLKVGEDKDLMKQMETAADDCQREKIACDAGFKFSMQELKQAINETAVGGPAGQELTDEALESVWGGTTTNIVSVTSGGILPPKLKP